MLEIIQETLIDSIKLLPFLFVTYLLMEYIEHKMKNKSKDIIKKSGKLGPLIGGILGVFPQCGFSVSATNLYAGRIITLGTLMAVYLSTSDEMLPILISEAVQPAVILKILGIKLIIGILVGTLIDLVQNLIKKKDSNIMQEENISHICEGEHCHCDKEGIFKSALNHTIHIFIFIILITLVINIIVNLIGEESIEHFVLNKPIIGPALSALIGLIPNCAVSVVLTNMYLKNIISVSSLIAGLLTGAGISIIVLFKSNKGIKENLKIIGMLYAIGVISGIILGLVGLQI